MIPSFWYWSLIASCQPHGQEGGSNGERGVTGNSAAPPVLCAI